MPGQSWYPTQTVTAWPQDQATADDFMLEVSQSTWEGMREGTAKVMSPLIWGVNAHSSGLGYLIVLAVLALFARLLWRRVGDMINGVDEGAKVFSK